MSSVRFEELADELSKKTAKVDKKDLDRLLELARKKANLCQGEIAAFYRKEKNQELNDVLCQPKNTGKQNTKERSKLYEKRREFAHWLKETVAGLTIYTRIQIAALGEPLSKIFVLDTNILMHDPGAIYQFGEENIVVIPLTVIEELDKLKNDNIREYAAREATRALDKIRAEGLKNQGRSLHEGVKIPNGPYVFIVGDDKQINNLHLDKNINDNKIIASALYLQKEHPDKKVVLVSNDSNVILKGDGLGIYAEKYTSDQINITDIEKLKDPPEIKLTQAQLTLLSGSGKINIPTLKLNNNQGVILKNYRGEILPQLGWHSDNCNIELIRNNQIKAWGIKPKGKDDYPGYEQTFALRALRDPNIDVVALIGKAGTGKTYLSLGAALEGVIENNQYERIIVARPLVTLGKDQIGFLPGELGEKLKPWMQPVYDNLHALAYKSGEEGIDPVEDLIRLGKIEIEPLQYIRGRTIPNAFIVIDEAQNTTSHEMKTIISRAGDGTKIVLTGDIYQIDHLFLQKDSCGLAHAAKEIIKQNICYGAVITFFNEKNNVRSRLSAFADSL